MVSGEKTEPDGSTSCRRGKTQYTRVSGLKNNITKLRHNPETELFGEHFEKKVNIFGQKTEHF